MFDIQKNTAEPLEETPVSQFKTKTPVAHAREFLVNSGKSSHILQRMWVCQNELLMHINIVFGLVLQVIGNRLNLILPGTCPNPKIQEGINDLTFGLLNDINKECSLLSSRTITFKPSVLRTTKLQDLSDSNFVNKVMKELKERYILIA